MTVKLFGFPKEITIWQLSFVAVQTYTATKWSDKVCSEYSPEQDIGTVGEHSSTAVYTRRFAILRDSAV